MAGWQRGVSQNRFRDRVDAAQALAASLDAYRARQSAVILAIPRGGVAVGAVLAKALDLPLDVILTKKIGHPESPEMAIGVVSLAGEKFDDDIIERDGVSWRYVSAEAARIRAMLRERSSLYRGEAAPVSLRGKTAIIVDDGIATGYTMAAAVLLAKRESPKSVVAAAPVASSQSAAALRQLADEVVCAVETEDLGAIGEFYESFEQVKDEEAVRLLRESEPRCQ